MKLKHDLRGSLPCSLFAALAFCLSPAWAMDYYVVSGGAGTRDGTSWTNALGDVQAAIDACAASGSGTVKIAAGTFKPTTQPNLVPSGLPAPTPTPPPTYNHFSLKNNVKVLGGYKTGTETRDPQTYPTVLSGDRIGNDKDLDGDGFTDVSTMGDNCRVFYHPPWVSIDSTAQLDGVTISGGCGRDNSYYPVGGGLNGGGMFNAAGISPTISNCVFRDNLSGGNGGAFCKEGAYANSAPILNCCTFVANTAKSGGAAAFSAASSSSVVNCTFVANSSSVVGGAVFTSGGSISFTNCTLVNNRSQELGGGVFSSAPVTNCIFWGNASNSLASQQLTANTVTYSIVQGGYPGAGNLNKDPLLLPLNNYGGFIPTMAMRGDSPAINVGIPSGPPFDQRGFLREAGYDIGAYEYRLGAVIYVKVGGTGNGTSWANAYGNLATAIAAAPVSPAKTTEIWVAEGAYTGTIALRSYISAYGGFSGVETKLAERDIATHPTILSADLNGDDADTDGDGIPDFGTSENASEVCSSHAVFPSAMLDGFILSGARTAAVRNYSGAPNSLNSPTITNCTFRYNAGVSVQNDSYCAPAILNCTFHHNATTSPVMANAVISSPSVVNCTFNNSSTKDSMPVILNQTQSSSPKFFNCTFAVGSYQTAMSNAASSQPMIRNCIIWGNSNTSGIQGGNPIVSHCVIQGGFGGGKNVSTLNPLLMPLENYAGPTPTMPVSAGSPAINQGLTGGDVPYADQRGFARDVTPDIGACEWQQNYMVIQTKEETDRYAIGNRASLNVVSESFDVAQLPGIEWQWYSGAVGDTTSPLIGATQSHVTTPALKEYAAYWVRGIFSDGKLDAGISLNTYPPHVIYLSTTGDDANDGSTWALAKRNLQSALDGSKSGDHIWVGSGTYTNPTPTPISMRGGVSVYGGFSGTETRLDQRGGYSTILSADQLGNDIDYVGGGSPDPSMTQDNNQVIIEGNMIGTSAVLDGFVFSGATMAAVVNANGSSPTISNCTFRDNSETSVQNENSSSPAIVNCTFSANRSQFAAPVIVNQMQSSPKITNCTFAVGPNQAAIYDAYGDSNSAILNSIIWGNAYSNAIQMNNAVVSHCVIQNGYSSGTNILMEDPKLMPIGMYGGLTPTMPVSAGSGAVNQGQTGTHTPYADQRGFVRDGAPDIGACEWQQTFAVIRSGNATNRFAIGSTATLGVISESGLPGTIWQWYRGTVGDTSSPIAGATQPRYATSPLKADASYWVRGTTPGDAGSTIDAGTHLSVYAPHVIFVSTTGSDGDGSTWSAAKRSLQSALAAAQSGDMIWVAEGTYRETISLRTGVSVYGGFSGMEMRLDQRDISALPTILSADTNGNDIDLNGDGVPDSGTTENAPSVCSNSGVDSTAVLDGFILSGAKTAAVVNYGAASTSGSSPTISNCTFRYNVGTSVENRGSSAPDIQNCTFHHNNVYKTVIKNSDSSSPAIVNCTFSAQPAPSPYPSVENISQSSPKITNCTFVAGWIYNATSGSPTIRNCILWDNAVSAGIMGTPSSVSSCVIQGGFAAGTNILTQDPKLLPLGDYGGRTPTMPVSEGSVAINQGVSGADVPYTDQRWFVRDALPDIGACEWQKQDVIAVQTEEGTDRYAIGAKAVLYVDFDLPGTTWQWYRGLAGDTSNAIAGATLSRYGTPPLAADVSYWARGTSAGGMFDASIALTVFSPHVIYVSTAGSDAMDGSSWQTAKQTLQGALNASQVGDHIWVAAGTYAAAFSLRNDVSVYGGFSGTETRLDQRDIAANATILTADLNGDDADLDGDGIPDSGIANNAPYVCWNSNIGASGMLDGLIFSGAASVAVSNVASSPTISNCTFRHNPGTSVGNTNSSSPVIRSCTFHHNAPARVVVGNSGSSPTIENCTFDANSPAATAATIANSPFDVVVSTPEITNCTFVVGASQSAVFSSNGGYPKIRNCIIWGNPSPNGISGDWSTVSNCVIQGGFNNRGDIVRLPPLLLPLANYGGPTSTMPLSSGSPAINAGASGPDIPYADQRGFVRDAQPDIGACEFGVAVGALAGDEPGVPGTIGATPSVSAHTDRANPAYQWFYGAKGDTSQPVPGGNSQALSLGPIEFGSKVWARITPGDGSAAIDTSERTFKVEATYDQWCDFHGLNGAERATDATVAGDGVGNLLKFALGLRPRDRSAIGDRSTTNFDNTTSKLTQEWRLSKTPKGVTIIFEGSNDLKTWLPVTPVMTGQDAGFETWKTGFDSRSPSKAAFLRARVINQ